MKPAKIAVPEAPAWSRDLFTVGTTGTNGKTTTTTWIAAALSRISKPVLCATTLGYALDDEQIAIDRTYDGFVGAMRMCLDRGGKYASIEMTSETLARGFAKSWPVRVGVFTNLTHDHLDAHGSAEHYLASKAQLFLSLPKGGVAVLNGCDPSSALLAEVMPAGVRIVRYGSASRGSAEGTLDLSAAKVDLDWNGTTMSLESSGALGAVPKSITLRAIGDVYAENALAALAAAIVSGVPAGDAARAIEAIAAPPGRFEVVHTRPYVVVDYAHSPDAIARTLAAAKRIARGNATPGLVTIVFGAGGNRDREKRAPMGRAASVADRVILTSDNPRDEDPSLIAAAIRVGLASHPNVIVELDRKRAIERAILGANDDDVILIAGRGHETVQTLKSGPHLFSDRDVALAVIAART